jgi:hypothetical protein
VTMLAHNAAVCGVPLDPRGLWEADPLFLLWVGLVVDRVEQTHAAEARRMGQ